MKASKHPALRTATPAALTVLAFALALTFALAIAIAIATTSGCASTQPPTSTPTEPARLIIDNPGVDSWDLRLGQDPRGSVAPKGRTTLDAVPPGPVTLHLDNARTGLSHRIALVLRAGATDTVTVAHLLSRLVVVNPHDEPVEVAIDGVVQGLASPATTTTFDGVPAGRRLVVLKSTRGPGAVSNEHTLPHNGMISLTVPPLAAAVGPSDLPRPPDGSALVRMRNQSRLAVTLFVNGVDRGLVASGGVTDVILPPGTHQLEVRIEGLDARTEHSVTLRPNQVAEWAWGEP
jgi:hypothetical protein